MNIVVGQLPTLTVAEGGRPTPEAWELFTDKLDIFFRVSSVPEEQQKDWLLSYPGLLSMTKTNTKWKFNKTFIDIINLLQSSQGGLPVKVNDTVKELFTKMIDNQSQIYKYIFYEGLQG